MTTPTGAGRLVVQIGETRFVVDCRMKPVKLLGQLTTNVGPIVVIVSCGRMIRLNTVPLPELPPAHVVP